MAIAHNLGFPPIGAGRELKRATEGYWGGKVSRDQLLRTGAELRAAHWRLQRDAGLDLVPVNDFSFYDRVLDTCAMVGAVPERYGWSGATVDLDTYFAMARGSQGKGRGGGGGRDVGAARRADARARPHARGAERLPDRLSRAQRAGAGTQDPSGHVFRRPARQP